jgi:hypothetical protein
MGAISENTASSDGSHGGRLFVEVSVCVEWENDALRAEQSPTLFATNDVTCLMCT